MSSVAELPLSEVVEAFRKKSLSPGEYLDALTERIGLLDSSLNAFIEFDAVLARSRLARSSGGPLGGIPVAVKDNIVTRGGSTTCGSRILAGFRSPFDATAVSRLQTNGAYVLGKTNLDEFAMGSSTEHSAFGVTRNPWDRERVAGGSSGGSAAAVAARLVPVALGSETGGSVRQPAAFCGVLGLKPTWGRISRSGLVAFASSLDQIGIVARSARDCGLLFAAIAGNDPADSTSASEPVDAALDRIEEGIAGVRFGIVKEAVEQLTPGVRANFEQAVAILEGGGARVEEVSIPSIGHAIAVYYIIANAEASANLARFDGVRFGHRTSDARDIRSLYFRSRGEGFGREVKRRIMLGAFALSSGYYDAYYGRAQRVRTLMRRDFSNAFERVDFLLTPTTPGPAFRVGERVDDPLRMYLSDIFTAPANLVGIPAIAIPSGLDSDGLPLSLQVMGRHFSEGELFRVAYYLEREGGVEPMSPPAGA
ncbi:MAG TPA: Asp-tRNA(Asn)/Glu-tRNA(Gln) amidotransferase subunit GatA [Thermoanaerobaculia bacterium]|nr:Asp-tRNA(Asn)/Glu-tRNA(Gln) amidotransferase subunit GatA [Thermoanaerobaculia bacterium]